MKFSKNQIIIFSSIAILLICAMTFSSVYAAVIAAEYIKASGIQVVNPENTATTALPDETATEAPDNTEPGSVIDVINGQPGDNSDNLNTTKSGSSGTGTGTGTTAKSNNTPSTKAEIASLYKAANNKARTKAKKATLTYKNAENYKDVVEAGYLSSIGSFLMNTFLKEEADLNEIHTDDIANAIPPANVTCNLKESDINKATCSDKGTYYFVTILLKPDKNPKAGYGSGSICSIITPDQITQATEGYIEVSNIICQYDGAYCEAEIDKKTGNLTKLYIRLPMYLSLTAKAPIIPAVDGKVGLQFEEKWTIVY
ncbi:MAG TPA: hypothetical protein PKN28_04230 [Clostridiales bacterium]|nr:hypothetical protein [Clostridiales bacterium]